MFQNTYLTNISTSSSNRLLLQSDNMLVLPPDGDPGFLTVAAAP